MSVSASTSRVQYDCNGSTVAFPFLFGIQETSDIQVILTDSNGTETTLTETTHYVVSAVNSDYESGGTVTTVATYADGYTITLVRNVPITQESDFTEGMPTLYETFEDGLDKLTMIAQQIEEKIDRQLVVPVSEPSTISRELPSATARAGKFLGFDDEGEPVAVTEIEGVSLTTFGNSLLTSTDAAEARTALETYSETETDAAISDAIAAIPSNFMEFTNLSFTASVASKALTVALKGTNGENPSATNKIIIPFRSATLTSSIVTSVEVTSALSVVLSSGSTLGFTAAEAGRIYVWAINNAGTVVLGLSRTAVFSESNLVSTTAEGGAGAADSTTVMYSTAAQTDKACRCIGYIEITTGGTAGEWDNSPTKIQVMGPGVRRSGDIVQKVIATYNVALDTALTIPLDNTKPQIGEGYEIFSQAFVATSAINNLEVKINSVMDSGAADGMVLALFNGAADCIRAVTSWVDGANSPMPVCLVYTGLTGSTAPVTYSARVGSGTSHTYVNMRSSGTLFNNGLGSVMEITEVFA